MHLTDARDARLSWFFHRLTRQEPLVELFEIYPRRQWGLDLVHQPLSA